MKHQRRFWLLAPFLLAAGHARADLAFLADSESKTVEAFALGSYEYFGSLGFGDIVDPRGVAQSATSVFVSDATNLRRYDLATFGAVDQAVSGSALGRLAAGDGGLYAVVGANGVARYDPDTLDLLDTFRGLTGASSLLTSPGALYVGRTGGVSVLDPISGSLLGSIADGRIGRAIGLARSAAGDLFVLDGTDGQVEAYDAAGTYRFSFGRGFFPKPIDIGISTDGEVWVVDADQKGLVQFDTDGDFLGFVGNDGANVPYFANPVAMSLPAVRPVPESGSLAALTLGFAALSRHRRK